MLQSYCYDSTNFSYRKIPKTKVFKFLINAFQEGDFEKACHWTTEIDLSGWQIDYFDICFVFISDQIHILNPKLPFYVYKFFEKYLDIKIKTKDALNNQNRDVLRTLNNEWRSIWVHITGILSMSQKSEIIPLPRGNLGDLPSIMNSEASNPRNFHRWTNGLPEHSHQEKNLPCKILLTIGSLLCNFIEEGNYEFVQKMLALFIEVEAEMKSKKMKFHCIQRSNLPSYENIETNGNKDDVIIKKPSSSKKAKECDWTNFVWDILQKGADEVNNQVLKNAISSLHVFFCLGFTTVNSRNKRMSILLHAIQYLYPQTSKFHNRFMMPILPQSSSQLIMKAVQNVQILYDTIQNQAEEEKEQTKQYASNVQSNAFSSISNRTNNNYRNNKNYNDDRLLLMNNNNKNNNYKNDDMESEKSRSTYGSEKYIQQHQYQEQTLLNDTSSILGKYLAGNVNYHEENHSGRQQGLKSNRISSKEKGKSQSDKIFNWFSYTPEKLAHMKHMYFNNKKIPRDFKDRLALIAFIDKHFKPNEAFKNELTNSEFNDDNDFL